ncbi:c-type cytochrome [Azospirillum rugosum]|uniref:Cytochrome c553 n=1 Tax=Azospirillum rugosum TaxID=416170 RepID=A0ABS4SR25_9PROT|nr:c-type cytochrome [Azospirillum rugosum]MBP2295011.1 cytochrome c553 [Azospirillum rugosum]MDQ0528834.1 cytochrome c553 [Azospirillum rugosum]
MRRMLMILAGVLAVQAVGGFLFAWSGLYSVAASKEHWPPVYWFLHMAMRNSIETHSIMIDAPSLDDPALIRRGAGHYEDGCAPCHGAPDSPRNPISRHMLPTPPHLPGRVADWTPEQLYWITLNGIKYAGMPAWPAQARDDEPWAVAAFLRRLDDMDGAEYRRLAFGEEAPAEDHSHMAELAAKPDGPIRDVLDNCARCHGYDGAGDNSGAFPRLSGQNADYLHESLRSYAAGTRFSGIMQPVTSGLDDGVLRALADHYAGQSEAPYPDRRAEDPPDLLQRGADLAAAGDPQQGVPACSGCHGANRDPRYPGLDGQHAGYIADQLRLWKQGKRGTTALSRIMEAAARDLTEDQIRAVSLHYARVRPQEASAFQP